MKNINFHSLGKSISLALIFVTLILIFPLVVWGLDIPTITTWTNVSGIINSDTTWTLANSPYIVTGNVLVNENVTLTIEPAVTVKFDSGKSLVVNGELIARGTRDEKIIFTSNQAAPAPGHWGQIYLADTCLDAIFNSSGNYVSGTILEHCIIEYGGNSSSGMLYIGNSRPFINFCLVSYSSVDGIHAGGSGASGWGMLSAKLTNNIIYNNMRYGIFSQGVKTDISNNIIKNNAFIGVCIQNSSSPISNNIVIGNSSGGIYGFQGPGTITKNVIHNNKINSKGVGIGGIRVDSSGGTTISNNIISNNITSFDGGGISISGGTHSIVGNSFVSNISPLASAVFSDANSPVQNVKFNHNLFFNNTSNDPLGATILISANQSWNYNNYIANHSKYEIYNDITPDSLTNCESNWWGTTDEFEIQGRIYDFFDDGSKGLVDYFPFLTSPDTAAPISPPSDFMGTAAGNNISLTWSPNPESDLKGYRVYWDTDRDYPYANSVDVGNVTSYSLTSLPPDRYYVAVTAYDNDYDPANDDPATIVNENQTNGNESWYTTVSVVTNNYTLNVTKTGSGTGTVTSSPVGIDCGSDCSESYTYNTSVILTAQPSTDSIFSGWTGCDYVSANECTVNMTSDKTITASFGLAETVSTPSILSGPTSGTVGTSYNYSTGGSTSNLSHDVQYLFDWGDQTNSGWLPVGIASASHSWGTLGTYPVKTQARCAADTDVASSWSSSLSVNISPATLSYTITTNPSGLQITVDGTLYTAPQAFDWTPGSSHNLSVSSPQSGTSGTRYIYSSWSDGGVQTHTITAPSSSTTYTAFFRTQYSLTTSVNPSVAGIITPSGTNWYYKGHDVSVSSTANSGYTFNGWSEDLSGIVNPTSVTMDGPKNVVANFTPNQYTLSVNINPSGSGSVTINPNKSTYVYGDLVELTANAATGYSFSNWSGDASGTTNPVTLTIDNNKTVTANFTELTGPDLTGSWTTPVTQTCKNTKKGPKCTIKGVLTINNNGNHDASSSTVKFYLSDSNTYDQGDTPLKSVATGKIKVKKSKAINLSYSFPLGQIVTDKYIIAVIDIYNSVKEIDETNNVIVFGPIQ